MTPDGRALYQRIGSIVSSPMARRSDTELASAVQQAIEDYEVAVGAGTRALKRQADEEVRLVRAASGRAQAAEGRCGMTPQGEKLVAHLESIFASVASLPAGVVDMKGSLRAAVELYEVYLNDARQESLKDGQSPEARLHTYDLYEDVLAKVKHGKLSRYQEHRQLERVFELGVTAGANIAAARAAGATEDRNGAGVPYWSMNLQALQRFAELLQTKKGGAA